MSLIIKQIIPKIPPPSKEILIINDNIVEELNKYPKRIIPYPPSFNKIPAKIIEPPTGASTWALGSHWCTKYIGNFTKKAVTENIIKIGTLWTQLEFTERKNIELEQFSWIIIIIVNNRGREAKRV